MKRILPILALLLGCNAPAPPTSDSASATKHIRLDITGDPDTIRKFSLLLQAELVGSHVALVADRSAELTLSGHMERLPQTEQFTYKGETRSDGLCPKTWTDESSFSLDNARDLAEVTGAALGDGSDPASPNALPTEVSMAPELARQARAAFPRATFVYVDPASVLLAPSAFPAALKGAYLEKKLIPSSDMPEALHVLIQAQVVKIDLNGTSVSYQLKMIGDGADFQRSSTGSLENVKVGAFPSFCPVADRQFPTDNSDPLDSVAVAVARSLSPAKP
jgi:hypothetical protein